MNLCDEFAHENPIIIPCPDSAGARKGAKGSRKRGVRAVFGYHNFGPPYIPWGRNAKKTSLRCLLFLQRSLANFRLQTQRDSCYGQDQYMDRLETQERCVCVTGNERTDVARKGPEKNGR